MPTYQYVCNDCGSDLEAVQSFSEPSLSECPTCDGKLRKRFSAVGVVFKGSGFYRNDSRSEARSASSKADKGEKVGANNADKPDNAPKTDAKSEPATVKTSTDSKPKSDSAAGSSKGSASASTPSKTSNAA